VGFPGWCCATPEGRGEGSSVASKDVPGSGRDSIDRNWDERGDVSLVDVVLLRPLPFPRQQSIEVIWKVDPRAGRYVEELAYSELRDLQEKHSPISSMLRCCPRRCTATPGCCRPGAREPVQIESAPVSHDFFRVLGVSPVLGRDFNDSDERVDAAPVVIVSDRVWRKYLGSDPYRRPMIRLNGQGYTVIGVMAGGGRIPSRRGFLGAARSGAPSGWRGARQRFFRPLRV